MADRRNRLWSLDGTATLVPQSLLACSSHSAFFAVPEDPLNGGWLGSICRASDSISQPAPPASPPAIARSSATCRQPDRCVAVAERLLAIDLGSCRGLGKKAVFALPASVLTERAESQCREFVVEVLPVAFLHGPGVSIGRKCCGASVNHVGHRLLGRPDAERGERAHRAHRRERKGGRRVVTHLLFHRPAPANEPQRLRHSQACQSDSDDGLLIAVLTGDLRQAAELADVPPPAHELVASARPRPLDRRKSSIASSLCQAANTAS